jgi:hypothetical protein
MWTVQTMLVEVMFRGVHRVADRRRATTRGGTTAVPSGGRSVNLEMRNELRGHVLPGQRRHRDAM